MRAFVIDEITPEDMDKLETRLKELGLVSIEHLFHFHLPPRLLSPMQQEHEPQCGPFYMAVETGRDWVRLELLVRAKRILRCACIAYATPEQQEYMTAYLEDLLKDLNIPV